MDKGSYLIAQRLFAKKACKITTFILYAQIFLQKNEKKLSFFAHFEKKHYFCSMNRRNLYGIVSLTGLLVVLAVLDVCCGSVFILPFGQKSLLEELVLTDIRLPKMLTAILAGASLSVAGLMMQTLFRNPLAGPYILGVSSGAGLGVALVTMGAYTLALPPMASSLSIVLAAVIGSGLVMALVMWVARYVKSNVSLLIVGMMFGAIAGALVNLVQNFSNPDSLKLFIVWTLGSLNNVGWSELTILAIVLLLGWIVTILLLKPLNGLVLGENYARSLGIQVERTRLWIVLATGLLAGSVTAFCGPIAFVGVAVPHIARGLVQSGDHRWTMPMSALIGADLILLCDILCNLFTHPLPISTLSALFGAPIILSIILKQR